MREFKDPHTPFLVKKSHYLSLTNLKNITNFTAMHKILIAICIIFITTNCTNTSNKKEENYILDVITETDWWEENQHRVDTLTNKEIINEYKKWSHVDD